MSKFATLKDFRTDDDDHDDHDHDDEQPGQQANQYYAGGSERSGQLIEDPSKNKDDIVKNMFRQARANGATTVDEGPSSQRRPQRFAGSGNRLGDGTAAAPSASDTAAPAGAEDEGEEGEVDRVTHHLTFWRDGFTVNEGPLRRFDDPANRQFLQDVGQGLAPRELLLNATRPTEVSINLVDRRQEEYKAPKKQPQAFAGSGYRLGNPTPTIAGAGELSAAAPTATAHNAAPTTTTTAASNALPPRSQLQIDESQPTTSIQIRLADGTRLVSKFNHTHTIADIRNFVAAARPTGGQSFALMTTFPNRELTDESQTIGSANLLNAVIVQKLK